MLNFIVKKINVSIFYLNVPKCIFYMIKYTKNSKILYAFVFFFYTTITQKKIIEVYLLRNTYIKTKQDLTGNFKNKCHMDNQIVLNWIFKDLN